MIMNVMRKLPFSDKKEVITIDRLFSDTKGFHAILASEKGENFLFQLSSEKIRYLPRLKGAIVTSVSWNEDCGEDSTKDILLGLRDGGIYLYKVENNAKNGEIVEDNLKNLAFLPGNKTIESLEVFFFLISFGGYENSVDRQFDAGEYEDLLNYRVDKLLDILLSWHLWLIHL